MPPPNNHDHKIGDCWSIDNYPGYEGKTVEVYLDKVVIEWYNHPTQSYVGSRNTYPLPRFRSDFTLISSGTSPEIPKIKQFSLTRSR